MTDVWDTNFVRARLGGLTAAATLAEKGLGLTGLTLLV
jgi:hypothetical protein